MSNKTFDFTGDGKTSVFHLPVEPLSLVSVDGLTAGLTSSLVGDLLVLSGAQDRNDRFTVTVNIRDEDVPGGGDGGVGALEPWTTVAFDLSNGDGTPETIPVNFFGDHQFLVVDLTANPAKRIHVKLSGMLGEWEDTNPRELLIKAAPTQELLVDNQADYWPLTSMLGDRVRVLTDGYELATGDIYSLPGIRQYGITKLEFIPSKGIVSSVAASTALDYLMTMAQNNINGLQTTVNSLLYGGIDYSGASYFGDAGAQNNYADVNFNAYVSGAPGADTHPYFSLPLTATMKDVVVEVGAYWAGQTSLVLGIPTAFVGRLIIDATYCPTGIWVVPSALVNNSEYQFNPMVDIGNSGAFQIPPGGQAEIIMTPSVQYYGSYQLRRAILLSVTKLVPKWSTNKNCIARSVVAGTVIGEVAPQDEWVLNTFRESYGFPDGLIVGGIPPNGPVSGNLVNVVLEIKVVGPNANYNGWETKFEARYNAGAFGATNPLTVIKEVSAANKLGVGLRKFYGGLLTVKVYSYSGAAMDFSTDVLVQSADTTTVEAG